MLSYQKTNVVYTNETVVLKIPDSWGMYRNSGNKRITRLAEALVDIFENSTDVVAQYRAAVSFVKKYKLLDSTKAYSEAGDTDVREQVYGFFSKACKCVKLDSEQIWDVVYRA